MSSESLGPDKTAGKIVYLAGPSSSGKTTSTKALENAGWMRIEADIERPHLDIQLLKTMLLDDLTYLESHLNNPSPMNTIDAIHGKAPDKPPSNPDHYEKARKNLHVQMEKVGEKAQQSLLLHMLDKALSIARLGKSVIIDNVPMINDTGYASHEITRDTQSPNLWCYREFKIEQQLKYVSVDALMRNVLRRNSTTTKNDALEHREAPMVLEQYSDCFMVRTSDDQEKLGTLKVADFKKWIARAYTMDFFDIDPNHAFIYDGKKDIDVAIADRMEGFIVEMNNPDNAFDPKGDKVEGPSLTALKERQQSYPKLQDTIKEATAKIMQKMHIADDATTVTLTYRSSSGIKPTIIRDK